MDFISQYGESVSKCSQSKGINFKFSRPSSVLNEAPLIPISKPSSSIDKSSILEPVKECTTPLFM